jgi:hypothetical protein
MTKPTIRIYEIDGTFIDREMNEDEFAQYEKDQTSELVRQAEAEATAQAKAKLLERLGITADEAKLLLA